MNDTALLRYFQVEHYASRRAIARHLSLVDPATGDEVRPTPEPHRPATPDAA